MSADTSRDLNLPDLAAALRAKLTEDEIKRLAETLSDVPSACSLREILAPLPAGGWGSGGYPG